MWSIRVLDNTLKIDSKTKKGLWEINKKLERVGAEIWESEEDISDSKGCITFNYDHYEHMDFFDNNKAIISLLKKNKAKGRVTFGCLDGDQFGEFWGYEFDGKGKMSKLTGSLTWDVNGGSGK